MKCWPLKVWRPLVAVSVPLVLAVGIFGHVDTGPVGRCGFVVAMMSLYWVSEVIPLPVTGLLPLALFPLLGIMSTNETSVTYFKSTNFMFLGGLIMALAIEGSGLHQRIALKVLMVTGGHSLRIVMLGVMCATAFLSMWISNTATTAMMLPMIDAVVSALGEKSGQKVDEEQQAVREDSKTQGNQQQQNMSRSNSSRKDKNVRNMLLLALAYSANIGGTGTIIGTPPNLITVGVIEELFGEDKAGGAAAATTTTTTPVNFASWMMVTVPGQLVTLLLAWLWLQTVYLGFGGSKREKSQRSRSLQNTAQNEESKTRIHKALSDRYESLGSMSMHETLVSLSFLLLISLWATRRPLFVSGWSELLRLTDASGQRVPVVGDASIAMLLIVCMFVLPTKTKSGKFQIGLVTWHEIQSKLQWGVIILMGGGFAMAEGSKRSCLSQWLSEKLSWLGGFHSHVLQVTTAVFTTLLTEFMSNAAAASIIQPILAQLAVGAEINPLFVMIPAAYACSYAFMLPVATPPNAIVYAASDLRIPEMILTGLVMNVISVGVSLLIFNLIGDPILGISQFPQWAVERGGASSHNSSIDMMDTTCKALISRL